MQPDGLDFTEAERRRIRHPKLLYLRMSRQTSAIFQNPDVDNFLQREKHAPCLTMSLPNNSNTIQKPNMSRLQQPHPEFADQMDLDCDMTLGEDDCDMTLGDEEREHFDWEGAWAELETGSGSITEKSFAPSTQEAVKSFWVWFNKFNETVLCKRNLRTGTDALRLLTTAEIQLYLLYRLRSSRTIKKKGRLHRSTVEGLFKTLQMVYYKYTQVQLPRKINDAINKFIESTLTEDFDLIMERKEKPTCCVTDLFNLLYYHWCRDVQSTCHGRYKIQVAFLMQLIAYTSSRPGSIIEANAYKGLSQVLKYKDMGLSLLRNGEHGGVILVLEVTTTFLKGKRNKREPVTYVLYERRDNPIFCPIMNFLALAFADNAFMEGGIKKPEDLFALEIPDFKETLSINWKEDMLETPVFRRQEGTDISRTTPMAYRDLNHYVGRLGVLSGYPQRLTTYVLRRGAANAVDSPEVSEVQRNQIMGHSRADTFRKHYLHQTVKIDTQSAYLGTVSRSDLIRNIGLMSAKRDPRAPVKVDRSKIDLEAHPEIVKMTADAQRLAKRLRAKSKTLRAASVQDPAGHKAYLALQRRLNARKRTIERAEFDRTRKDWFSNVDHEEIKLQLGGAEASKFTAEEPNLCSLRTVIADYYKGVGNNIAWADALRALTGLCRQKPRIHGNSEPNPNSPPIHHIHRFTTVSQVQAILQPIAANQMHVITALAEEEEGEWAQTVPFLS
ncbi:uncharacterized protein LAJ45_10975 [Morchella importuna]|uniref:uncharacterized protein n=1 Tax=Morchella importuna TaxID=1174673 RepID=UPI001E8EAF22|nr:uncharacterized protein LAJ45_10975 [Morchella importuna]KAH8145064.1 hypothetical protein LAJ45_10975 [Morchella importuna]